ncbi:MAG: hypothetical protein R3F59_19510 [Myxococcota bacterium]
MLLGEAVTVTLPDDGRYEGSVEVQDDDGAGVSLPFALDVRNAPPAFASTAPGARSRPAPASPTGPRWSTSIRCS